MVSNILRLVVGAAVAASVFAFAQAASAQDFPSKPVKFIVPFPPGGPVDTVARVAAQKVSEYWGQPVLIENRAGAGGIVGAEVAARAAPDGYALFFGAIHHSVLPSLGIKLSYDIERDFVPVIFGARFPIILVASPSVPASNVKELIAYAKANPAVKERLLGQGAEPAPGTPAEFGAFLRAEKAKWAKVVKVANIKPD